MSCCDDLEPGLFPGFDEQPPDVSDLACVRRVVPPEQNAFALLDVKAVDIDWSAPENDRLKGLSEKFDLPRARELLSEHAKVLSKVDASFEKPDLQVPALADVNTPVPYLLVWRDLIYLLSCRARAHQEAGESKSALAEAVKLARLGYRIQGAQGAMIHYLVGQASKSIALSHVARLARAAPLADDDLRAASDELMRLGVHWEGLREALRVEFLTQSAALRQLASGEREAFGIDSSPWSRLMGTPPLFRIHETSRKLADEVRALIAEFDLPANDRARRDFAKKYEVRACLDGFLANGMGRILLSTLLPPIDQAIRGSIREDWEARAVRTLIAIKRFEARMGHIPDRLDELVPRFLDAIPLDPYDGQPLRYSAERAIIYSVGSDFLDGGGSAESKADDALRDQNEPTLKIVE